MARAGRSAAVFDPAASATNRLSAHECAAPDVERRGGQLGLACARGAVDDSDAVHRGGLGRPPGVCIEAVS
eukprot:1267252-Pyramimonas_sp.AAC.1